MSLIGLMSCLGLMGCSSDSGEQEPAPAPIGTAIAFSAQQGEEQKVAGARATRAGTPLSEAGVTNFKVWGYKNMSYDDGTGAYDADGTTLQTVFPGYNVNWYSGSSSASNSNGWEYVAQQLSGDEQTIKYWDWAAKAYRFFAVTNWKAESAGPYDENKTYGANDTYDSYGAYKITMVVDATNMGAAPYFTKLWFSTGNVDDYPTKQFGRPVQLEFVKPFTRVRFLFKYAYPREGIKLNNISFKPTADVDAAEEDKVKIARKGSVTVHYPKEGKEMKEWYTTEVDADKSTRLAALTVDYDPEDDGKDYVTLSSGMMTSDGWYVLLPNNTQGSYTLAVTVNGDAKKAVVPEQYMQWLPGYSYTYIFKITNEGGVEIGWVEYAVTPWTDLEADHMVYNW